MIPFYDTIVFLRQSICTRIFAWIRPSSLFAGVPSPLILTKNKKEARYSPSARVGVGFQIRCGQIKRLIRQQHACITPETDLVPSRPFANAIRTTNPAAARNEVCGEL